MSEQIGYPLPPQGFDALDHARNKVLRANQLQELILQQYRATYEDFWGVTSPPTGSRYTTEQMQQIINTIPQSTALDMMADSRAFGAFIEQAYPGVLPGAYRDSAFEMTIHNGDTIVVGQLRAEWQTPIVVSDSVN
jgi:hypothetical protein